MSTPERGRIADTEAASATETPTAGPRDHPRDSEGAASAFRALAAEWDIWYSTDIFRPLSPEAHASITDALLRIGHTRDAVSADMMRRAASLLRKRADEIERGDDR